MPFPEYATKEDLMLYLGLTEESQLPEEYKRLLKRASELIYYATLGNVEVTNNNHIEALRQATCAQVEYLANSGEELEVTGEQINSFSIGDVNMNLSGGSTRRILCNRAMFALHSQGLLYKGNVRL